MVVYFDGSCGLCNRTVQFLLRRDTNRNLRFASLQGTTAERFLSEDDRHSLRSLVVTHRGRTYRGSSAVVRVLAQLPKLWKAAALILWVVPQPLRDFGYRLVARNRHWFVGQQETCRLPSPEETAQLLP